MAACAAQSDQTVGMSSQLLPGLQVMPLIEFFGMLLLYTVPRMLPLNLLR